MNYFSFGVVFISAHLSSDHVISQNKGFIRLVISQSSGWLPKVIFRTVSGCGSGNYVIASQFVSSNFNVKSSRDKCANFCVRYDYNIILNSKNKSKQEFRELFNTKLYTILALILSYNFYG